MRPIIEVLEEWVESCRVQDLLAEECVEITGRAPEEFLDGMRRLLEPVDRVEEFERPCGKVMVGSGPPAYDPVCELPVAHAGRCLCS